MESLNRNKSLNNANVDDNRLIYFIQITSFHRKYFFYEKE